MGKLNINLGNGNWSTKAGSILGYDQSSSGEFSPVPFSFTRASSGTVVNKAGNIELLSYGPELVVNGDFSQTSPELLADGDFLLTGTQGIGTGAYWVTASQWTISSGAAHYSDGSNSKLSQSGLTLVDNKSYSITFTISNATHVQGAYVWVGNEGGSIDYSGESYNWWVNGTHTINITMPSTQTSLGFYAHPDGGTFSISDISITEVAPGWYASYSTDLDVTGGVLDIQSTSGGYGAAFSDVGFVAGKKYELTVNVISCNSASWIRIGRTISISGYDANILSELDVKLGLNTVTWVADESYDYLAVGGRNDVTTLVVDNISVREVLEKQPRIDFSDNVNGALLLEPTSTNTLNRSDNFNPSPWGNYESSIINNQHISPNGDGNASKLIESDSLSIHRLSYSSVSITSGQNYTLSIFAKKGERDHLSLTNYDGGADTTTRFDLSNGEVVGGSGSIKSMGNGWYRCSKSFIAAVTTTSDYVVQVMIDNGSSHNYQGDGASGLYIWGAQLETHPKATSYIPTHGSQATRIEDVIVPTVVDINILRSFSMYFSLGATSRLIGSSQVFVNLSNPYNNIGLYINSGSGGLNVYIANGGGYVFGSAANNAWNVSSSKVCVTYDSKSGRLAYFINGALYGAVADVPKFGVVSDAKIRAVKDIVNIKEMQFHYKALTDVEAITLTTL